MAIGDYEVITRASRALRAAPEPGWAAVEQRVLQAVRTTPRAGWPFDAVDPDHHSAPGRIQISDLVLSTLIARGVADEPDAALVDVAVTLDDEILRGVRVDISGRFGADLIATADRIREIVVAIVAEVAGRDDVEISIDVVDVHRHAD